MTINGGARMRAWYDIDPGAPLAGAADIADSSRALTNLIDAEQSRGVPAAKVTLAGFSQGGVIALHTGIAHPNRLAGIMALSTYVHDHEHVAERVSFANVDTPIFMAHGLADPMIPIARAVASRDALTALNYQVDWHQYGMGHQVCPEEIADIARWLNSIYC